MPQRAPSPLDVILSEARRAKSKPEGCVASEGKRGNAWISKNKTVSEILRHAASGGSG